VGTITAMVSLSVEIPAEPAFLVRLRRELQRWLEPMDVPTELVFGVVAAVSEAAANAVEHPEAASKAVVELEAEREADRLTVRVRDHGRWREPRLESERNRGLLLISALMSQVDVDRSRNGTVVTMQLELGG
jgi:anti-sigma regulatory factor (Ser/Thr protein kinase)